MYRCITGILFLLLALISVMPVSAQVHFTAKLNGAQEVPPVTTNATGTGSFLLNADRTQLSYQITVCDLSGPISVAHFHRDRIGSAAAPIRNITFTGNSASGVWSASDATQPLTLELVTALLEGELYVNVHTAANTSGEIRGQVGAVTFTAKLDGAQEVPPVTTNATGTGFFQLSEDLTSLRYQITVCDLSGSIAAAHFHNAAAGATSPPVKTISFTGNTATGTWSTSDASQPLTSDFVTALLNGEIYVNVHTPANSGGEIRGQVLANSGISTMANINGAQEVPSVTTNATGTGSFVLNEEMTEISYEITVCDLSGQINVAHFHNGPFGVGASPVRNITFTGNTASGKWETTDATQPLTPQLIQEFLAGRIYVNVHTPANTGGEIRGQLVNVGLQASLDGNQEVPPVTTNATGTASLELSADRTSLKYDVTVCDLSGQINVAHFHNAPAGVGGNPIKTITFSGNTASGIWSASDATQPLTSDLLTALLNGGLYVNVHTPANSGGEIRGQVGAVSGIITGIKRHEEAIPSGFVLSPGFPNPFNPSTTLRFEIAQPSQVSIIIYNAIGQQVATLVNNRMNSGVYTVTWDARNADGRILPSGVYLARMEAGSVVQSQKLLLLK